MEEHRLPRKFLTSWCFQARPQGRPEFTYGEGLTNALKYAQIDVETWMETAQDRAAWKDIIRDIKEKNAVQAPHPVLLKKAIPQAEARARWVEQHQKKGKQVEKQKNQKQNQNQNQNQHKQTTPRNTRPTATTARPGASHPGPAFAPPSNVNSRSRGTHMYRFNLRPRN